MEKRTWRNLPKRDVNRSFRITQPQSQMLDAVAQLRSTSANDALGHIIEAGYQALTQQKTVATSGKTPCNGFSN